MGEVRDKALPGRTDPGGEPGGDPAPLRGHSRLTTHVSHNRTWVCFHAWGGDAGTDRCTRDKALPGRGNLGVRADPTHLITCYA
eukprot:3070362-Amphidinium_carterae.1